MTRPSNLQLDPRALRRVVLNRALRHPPTLGLSGATVGAGGWLIFSPSPTVIMTVGILVGLVAASFCFQYWGRRDHHSRDYIARLEAQRERVRATQLGEIRARLYDLASAEGVAAELAGQALEQYQRLHQRRAAFRDLLERKLNVGELTYVRYAGAVDGAYSAVITNLRSVADLLFADNALDDDLQEAISSTLNDNARAIAELSAVATAVAAMRDLNEVDTEGLDRVIDDLRSLSARAAKAD